MSLSRLKHVAAIAGAVAALAGAGVTFWKTHQELKTRGDRSYEALNERLVRTEAELAVWRELFQARRETLATRLSPALLPTAAAPRTAATPRRRRESTPRAAPTEAPPAPVESMMTAPSPNQIRAAVTKRSQQVPASVDALSGL